MSFSSTLRRAGLLGPAALALFGPLAASAQETAPEATEAATEAAASALNSGDTAWMLVSTILVLFMILPGLALFYGGLVRAKNVLSVLMQCTMITAAVIVVWVLWGYSFAFGGSESAFFGGFGKLFLSGVTPESESGSIPELVFICFQMTFACITPALIVGGFAERVKFGAIVLFVILWVSFVYFPIAHMAWDENGLFFGWGTMDFAGGTVVHINAGIAALVGAIVIGRRAGYGKENMAPHNLPLTLVGAAILWVGWFGFNAGSALSAGGTAALATINTFTATAGAVIAWSLVEKAVRGKASMLGGASGVIAGLVAVTPAAGFVGPVGAIVLGATASVVAYYFVAVVKIKLGYDDSLDVFGIHGVAGIVGAIGTGVFASGSLGGVGYEEGVTMGAQVWTQILAVLVTIVWCGVISAILYKLVDMLVGLRPTVEAESQGLDITSHGEVAYHS
ncbi:ammonium transporter [Aquamicrobium defluvii]|uniref:Ammonium transporter n=1 Tax=Aquamicrobium defluvii TaxID=69279 RepID=A0A011U1K7_9HYPH|nr:ammonium transporter [Aquamicrobium defluvii]EXL10307.1 ammonia channel protein [Aquamicrobium defluvii]EZQ17484.1 ammonia channel protein [Halopseudomonas bauzanensis]TDR37100.1 ammonium transporter [Aquamicrobium defluvii]